MKVKIVFGDDVRRWRQPESGQYEALKAFIKDAFNFMDESGFIIQFEDDENDKVTIASEKDFNDAFVCAEKEERKSLKLFVNVAASDSNDMEGESSSSSDLDEFSSSESSSGDESPRKESNCTYWRESALDFLQNEEIKTLLPQFVRRVVIALRNEQNKDWNKNASAVQEEKKADGNEDLDNQDDNGNEQKNEESKDFATILIEILSEEQFKPIASHKLVEEKLPFILPLISQKVVMYQQMLVAFNEDVIVAWIPHLIEILINGLKTYENVKFDIEMDGPIGDISSCIPQWFAFLNNKQDEEVVQESVHNGVVCDECNADPIVGARYKCTVCVDYDLCSKCESEGKHDASHPLIKFGLPLENVNEKDFEFGGLHETIWRLGGRRKVFGGWRRHRGRRGRGGHRGRGFHHGPFHRPHHGPHHGGYHHGHHGHGAPFGFHSQPVEFGCPPPAAAFEHPEGQFEHFEEFSSFESCSSPPVSHGPHFGHFGRGRGRHRGRGRGRGRRFGGRPGHGGFGPGFGFHGPHFGRFKRDENHGPFGKRKQMKKELKQQKKEFKHELNSLRKIQKQIHKKCCRVDKQISKLNKQAEKEKATKQEKKQKKEKIAFGNVSCICGETMMSIKANEAYPHSMAPVRCDACDHQCTAHAFIFHCGNSESLLHPNGYDICSRCAKAQQKSFVKNKKQLKKEKKERKEKKETKVDKEKKPKKERKGKSGQVKNDSGLPQLSPEIEQPLVVKKDEIEDIAIVKGNEVNEEDNSDGEEVFDMDIEHNGNVDNDGDVKDDQDKDDKENEVASAQEEKDFVYANELEQVANMGFGDNEHVRSLLLANKGNVGRVIEALLQ